MADPKVRLVKTGITDNTGKEVTIGLLNFNDFSWNFYKDNGGILLEKEFLTGVSPKGIRLGPWNLGGTKYDNELGKAFKAENTQYVKTMAQNQNLNTIPIFEWGDENKFKYTGKDLSDINTWPLYDVEFNITEKDSLNLSGLTNHPVTQAGTQGFATATAAGKSGEQRLTAITDPFGTAGFTEERAYQIEKELGQTDPTGGIPVDIKQQVQNILAGRGEGTPIGGTAESVQAGQQLATQKASIQTDILKYLEEVYPDTKGIFFDREAMGLPPRAITQGQRFSPDSEASLEGAKRMFPESFPEGMTLQEAQDRAAQSFKQTKGVGEDSFTFTFDWDPETLGVTRLDILIDGAKKWSINDPAALTQFNSDLTTFSLGEARKEVKPSLSIPSPTDAAAQAAAKAGGGTAGTIGAAGTGLGAFPLGQNLAAPGIDMPGSLQQQALSRVPLSTYRQTLPQAMPGGGIPLMRGLYKSPLELAQEAYLLSSRMGTFQGVGVPEGTGALEFQQYLGGQPDYIGDLQAGLGAIEQVKNKIISGVSPDLLSDAEKQIYINYIGGSESNPYQGSENELALRQRLTQLLPAPLRGAASQNLQSIYNQALATRPTTVAGMPQSLMYGGATGTGSPFASMAPMSVNVPTGTSPYQRSPQQPASVKVTGGVNMNNALTTAPTADVTRTQTEDGQSIIFKRDPITGGMVGTLEEGKTGRTGTGMATAAEIDALGLGLPSSPTGGAFGNVMVSRINDKVVNAWSKSADGTRTPLMQALGNTKQANDEIKARQLRIANEKAQAEAQLKMTGSQQTQLKWGAPPSPPGMNAPIQPFSSVNLPKDITDPSYNVLENIFK